MSATSKARLWYRIVFKNYPLQLYCLALKKNHNCLIGEPDSGSSKSKVNTTPFCMFVVGTNELKVFAFCKENPEEDYIKWWTDSWRRWIKEARTSQGITCGLETQDSRLCIHLKVTRLTMRDQLTRTLMLIQLLDTCTSYSTHWFPEEQAGSPEKLPSHDSWAKDQDQDNEG